MGGKEPRRVDHGHGDGHEGQRLLCEGPKTRYGYPHQDPSWFALRSGCRWDRGQQVPQVLPLWGRYEHELEDDELWARTGNPRLRRCQGASTCCVQCQGEGKGDGEG